MNLHIFNPEHDIALACDKAHVTIPHAAQELRMNLGYLPALWAENGDFVLVDDIKYAIKASAQFKKLVNDVIFVNKADLSSLPIDKVVPWGWDKRVRAELIDNGVDKSMLPTDEELLAIRELSGRSLTVDVLGCLRSGIEKVTCGTATACLTMEEVEKAVSTYRNVVAKAPWSSSGRGIRYVTDLSDTAKRSWISKIISRQGYVMIEPYYNKVCDFAVEFLACPDDTVKCCGLSVFHTLNSQYTGNVVASEEDKRMRLGRYVDMELLDKVVSSIESCMSVRLKDKYTGPFGVDMMAVADQQSGKLFLHPCVEVNLRNTMGHVALALSQKSLPFASMMSITHKVNYQLSVERIEGRYVNVIYR